MWTQFTAQQTFVEDTTTWKLNPARIQKQCNNQPFKLIQIVELYFFFQFSYKNLYNITLSSILQASSSGYDLDGHYFPRFSICLCSY